jgi:hypothetical protein
MADKEFAARMANLLQSSNQHREKVVPPIGGTTPPPISQKDAATLMSVGERTLGGAT